jgi:hypothetical protein
MDALLAHVCHGIQALSQGRNAPPGGDNWTMAATVYPQAISRLLAQLTDNLRMHCDTALVSN